MHAKVLRLHAARRQILANDARQRILQIAVDLGFAYTRQFAIADYRLFGERPSQTTGG